MANIAITSLSQAGAAPTFVAAAGGGDAMPSNTGREFLHVKNGDASPITVTINSIKACDQGFDHNLVVTVPATGERIIGPFPVSRFTTTVGITYSAVTTVTVAAFRA